MSSTNQELYQKTAEIYGTILDALVHETRKQFSANRDVHLDDIIQDVSTCKEDHAILTEFVHEYHQICKYAKNYVQMFNKVCAPICRQGSFIAFGVGVVAGLYLGSYTGSGIGTALGGAIGGFLFEKCEESTNFLASYFYGKPIPDVKGEMTEMQLQLCRKTFTQLMPYTEHARIRRVQRMLEQIFSDEPFGVKDATH